MKDNKLVASLAYLESNLKLGAEILADVFL